MTKMFEKEIFPLALDLANQFMTECAKEMGVSVEYLRAAYVLDDDCQKVLNEIMHKQIKSILKAP